MDLLRTSFSRCSLASQVTAEYPSVFVAIQEDVCDIDVRCRADARHIDRHALGTVCHATTISAEYVLGRSTDPTLLDRHGTRG